MLKYFKNQQQQENKLTEQNWCIKFAPLFVTMMPAAKQDIDRVNSPENYVNIEELKSLELELDKTKKQLQASELIKIDLIKNIGHSINVPCHGIFAQAAVLHEMSEDPSIKNCLAILMNCAKALLDYSANLADFLRNQAEVSSITMKQFNPQELIDQSITKAIAAAKHKGLRLVSNIHYEIPDSLTGDNYRIQAILDQLISNSITFTEQGTIVITANLFSAISNIPEEQHTNNNEQDKILQLIVHDTGIGIAEEKQQHITQQLLKDNCATQAKGLGLGLMFVKHLIEELQGKIELSSQQGKNTTVTCYLPVKLSQNS